MLLLIDHERGPGGEEAPEAVVELRGAAGPLDALREPLGHHRVLVEGAVEEDERAVVLRVADEAARGLVDVAVRLGLVPRLAIAAGVLDFETRRRVEARRVRHADDHDAAAPASASPGSSFKAAARAPRPPGMPGRAARTSEGGEGECAGAAERERERVAAAWANVWL